MFQATGSSTATCCTTLELVWPSCFKWVKMAICLVLQQVSPSVVTLFLQCMATQSGHFRPIMLAITYWHLHGTGCRPYCGVGCCDVRQCLLLLGCPTVYYARKTATFGISPNCGIEKYTSFRTGPVVRRSISTLWRNTIPSFLSSICALKFSSSFLWNTGVYLNSYFAFTRVSEGSSFLRHFGIYLTTTCNFRHWVVTCNLYGSHPLC